MPELIEIAPGHQARCIRATGESRSRSPGASLAQPHAVNVPFRHCISPHGKPLTRTADVQTVYDLVRGFAAPTGGIFMFGFTRYNYDRFRREMLQRHPSDRWGRAPEPGDEAPGFELRSLTGEMVKLSDFKNSRNVVLTFGSATCPQTAASIGGLRSLAREFSALRGRVPLPLRARGPSRSRASAAPLHGRQSPRRPAAARAGADRLPRPHRRTRRRGPSQIRRAAQRLVHHRQERTHRLPLAGQPRPLARRGPGRTAGAPEGARRRSRRRPRRRGRHHALAQNFPQRLSRHRARRL